MCQAASPRWRPNREIAWHPERYPGEEEEVISSAMNVSEEGGKVALILPAEHEFKT